MAEQTQLRDSSPTQWPAEPGAAPDARIP